MSEISQGAGGGSKDGKVRVKKASTRIDMTPMVDLAFLLLTFFILTTTLNKPQTMELTMPEKPKGPEEKLPEVNEKKVVTIILGANDKVYWYHGITDPKIEATNFSKDGIRKVLIQKNKEIPGMIILIKPSKESRYKNMVDILDEMTITDMKRFAMVKITPVDEELVKESNL